MEYHTLDFVMFSREYESSIQLGFKLETSWNEKVCAQNAFLGNDTNEKSRRSSSRPLFGSVYYKRTFLRGSYVEHNKRAGKDRGATTIITVVTSLPVPPLTRFENDRLPTSSDLW